MADIHRDYLCKECNWTEYSTHKDLNITKCPMCGGEVLDVVNFDHEYEEAGDDSTD